MQNHNKLFVIGLDGGTYNVLLPLAQRGYMPYLAKLMNDSTWGDLVSTIPPFTAPAWTTFITGQSPGTHGVISFESFLPHLYPSQQTSKILKAHYTQSLWQIISAAGGRVGVFNVPMTYPPESVNGVMVAGMLTPPNSKDFTFPQAYIESLGHDYKIDLDIIQNESPAQIEFNNETLLQILADLEKITVKHSDICETFIISEQWNFCMIVFTCTDRIFHFFWSYIEELISDKWRSVIKTQSEQLIITKLIEFFSLLDLIIGKLTNSVGKEANIVLMSDHGFGAAPTKRVYLNVWLEQLGLLKIRGANGPFDLESYRVKIGRATKLKSLLRGILPQSIQDSLSQKSRTASRDIIEWEGSKAYFVPIYFHVCGIEINLHGRNQSGIVDSGAEYDALRDELIQKAKELRDPHSNCLIVERAYRREDIFAGKSIDTFPDIILVLNEDYIGASSLASRKLTEEHHVNKRSGEHRDAGILLATGPAFAKQGKMDATNLLDLPPTLLYALNIPIPDSFEGKVIESLFHQEYLRLHPIRFQTWSNTLERVSTPELSISETDVIHARLRALGYLD